MTTDPLRRRQHLVSKGYQENFARNHRVAVVDRSTGKLIEERETKRNWRENDFVTVFDADGQPDDSLEREFAELERTVLNKIREISSAPMRSDQRSALDQLAAIHLTRSLNYASRHHEVTEAFFDDAVCEFMMDPRLRQLFEADHRRAPFPGELEALITQQVQQFRAQPDLLANGMRHGVASITQILARWQVELIAAPGGLPGFVLPDHPVLHAARTQGRYGFRDHLAVGDADLLMVPIRRRLLACYTNGHGGLKTLRTKKQIQLVNAALCRNARLEVACHPEDARDVGNAIRNSDRLPLSALE